MDKSIPYREVYPRMQKRLDYRCPRVYNEAIQSKITTVILLSQEGLQMTQEIAIVSSGDFVDLAPENVTAEDHTIANRWLRSKRSKHTQEAYARDIAAFYVFLAKNDRCLTIKGVRSEERRV